VRVAPGEQVAAKLTAVKGGGLAPTRWGSSRAYGLGEVHALAFDPTASESVDDQWVRRSMVELVRVAWDRRTPIAVAGEAAFDEGHTESARRTLDPNEGSRWTIWVSAIVLVVYALLAGPLSFRRAARRGTPLRAFVELPLWSFGAAILIVLAGAVAKGGRSRARRLSFMEVAAGERRAAILRFRALFASSAGSLGVKALDPSSLLDVAGRAPDVTRTLSLGRQTAELVDMHGRPWETVLVREDGYTDLDGTVRFVDAAGGVRIENGLARDLVGVVARAYGGDLRYFARIPHGTITPVSEGKALSIPPSMPAAPPSYVGAPHRLDVYRFAALVDADIAGSSDAWSAIEAAGRETTEYWPDDRATLIGEVERGDRETEDSGLRIDQDRLLLRVIGSGK
jgi:hypothetical protein